MLRREPDRLLARALEGISVAETHGYPVWIDHAGFWLGWALAEKGDKQQGINHLRRALVAYGRSGAGSSMPKFLGLLADRLGEIGEVAEGLALLEQALAHIERCGETANEAETYRLRGKLRMMQRTDSFAAAEADLHKAIAVAREQEAKGWELRAATSLARLWQQDERRLAARDVLAPVHEWFTEGRDTADLQEAEQLLRELQ
jgi:predicted ATPase